MNEGYGEWVEGRVRDVTAKAGVPDFVFKPLVVAKGGSSREIGDGLLWIGHQLAIVSVKSRSPDTGDDSSKRRDAWLTKHINKAVAQINGTHRMLENTADLVLQSERGVSIPWNRELVDQYTGVVVVDHRDLRDYAPVISSAKIPTVVMAIDDWRILHERYESTAAIVNYLAWRARNGLPSLPFEAEKDILASHHIAEEDLPLGTPFEIEPGAWERAWRDRPEIFFGTDPDHRYARVVDNMIAGAADFDPIYTKIGSPSDYLDIIEFLDRIALLPRVELGKGILKKCQEAGGDAGIGVMLSVLPQGMIVFISDSADRERRVKFLQALTAARHSQAEEATGITDLVTLGIATEPMPTAGRSHDFCLIRANFDFTEDEKLERDEFFGSLPPDLPGLLMTRYLGAFPT